MIKIKREYIARRLRTKIRLFASTFRGAYFNQINVMHN